jgi:ATP-dependent helicase HepA
MWKPGDRLTHRDNPGLGPGRVVSLAGRALEVEFPTTGARLRLAADTPALIPLELRPGQRVRRLPANTESRVVRLLPQGRVQLADGSEAPGDELWPIDERELLERLAAGPHDRVEDFALRLDALRLSVLREGSDLGSFLGGRIRLFPHQLHTAERATRSAPVRWLLADEVGLGKTVEACLVLNHLVRTRGIERCLVVAPATLTVQWLGELWRKYHQVFVLLDQDRLKDVARDYGAQFNPFDAHRRVVMSIETLLKDPRLTRWAVEAGIDLLVVDEAHHLRRPRGHAGEAAYRAVEPIARLGRNVLLLTATPLEDDTHGFFRLLQLLRPGEFPSEEAFEERLRRGEPLPACTSSTRRADIGGLPPRVAVPVELEATAWAPRLRIESTLREGAAADPLSRRRLSDRLRRALASGAALRGLLGPDEAKLRALADEADAGDPRLGWLARQARGWKERGDKTLVFVAHMESLELLRTELSRRAQLATAAFHEQLSPARRDIEVAQFRLPGGPSLLVSTEAGGEGRNFEFCHRLVLFDLPWNPVAVEQRIGRLDRIGRTRDVEVVFFRPPAGIGAEVARAFEAAGLFREPLAGLEPELASLEDAIEEAALGAPAAARGRIESALREAQEARDRVQAAAFQELHRDRYRPEMAEAILARIPAALDTSTAGVVVAACRRLGLKAEERSGRRTWSIEFGNEAIVDHLPGVAPGASFLGTFDRETAVADETIDFFSTGHPLVEGLLAHLDDSARGRVALLHVALGAERGFGLLALYRQAQGFEAVAVDERGLPRPDWAATLTSGPLRTRRRPAPPGHGEWSDRVRAAAAGLDPARTPVALAALIVEP